VYLLFTCQTFQKLANLRFLLYNIRTKVLFYELAEKVKAVQATRTSMITITTRRGKQVEIVLESELRSPVDMGERVRAYCHIHGSDHQRSLSIDKATGWGHCFNAVCGATVLVVEWNRPLAKRLLQSHYRGMMSSAMPGYAPPEHGARYRP
jgi:hypothetical protein